MDYFGIIKASVTHIQERGLNFTATMNRKLWQEMQPIIDKALSLKSSKERKVFVNKACKCNQQLRKQILDFLKNIKKAKENDFLI